MTTRKITLTASLILAFSLSNCIFDECNCPEVTKTYFDILGIGQSSHIGDYFNGGSGHIIPGDTIHFGEYQGFMLEYVVEYVAAAAPPGPGSNALWACSCISMGDYGAKDESYRDIYVQTLRDFNGQYRAGDTINSLVMLENQSLEDYLQFYRNYPVNYAMLTGTITEKPTADDALRLLISVHFNTGEVYQDTLPTIYFH